MITRSFDKDLMIRATKDHRDMMPLDVIEEWWRRPGNLMFAEGDNIGFASLEYPGVYTLHWYFKVRGREAIKLGQQMILHLFKNYPVQTVRGIIKTRLKHSLWAARQVGWKSYGKIVFPDGDENEVFFLKKDEFLQRIKNNG